MYSGLNRFILSIFCIFLLCGCNLSTNSTQSAEDFPSDIPETPIPSSNPSPEQIWIDRKLSTMSTEEKVGQLFFVRHSEQTATDVAAVIAAVKNGTLPEERLNASVARILQWKIDLRLIEVPQ